MLPRYITLFSRLTPRESLLLWARLRQTGLLQTAPPDGLTGRALGEACVSLMHSEVVTSIVDRPEPHWCDILDKLLDKPVYLCASGETGEPESREDAVPVLYPVGHRRGEPLGTGRIPYRIMSRVRVEPKKDRRVVVYVQRPNPKRPGSASRDRYDLYREGMEVTEFLMLGGTMGDVVHDSKKGLIRLDLPRA